SRRRADMALALGASSFAALSDNGVNYKDLLGGAPDIVFECSGAPGMIAHAIAEVRPRGTVVVLGYCTRPDQFIPSDALDKGLDIRFAVVYSRKDFEECLDAMNAGKLDPAVLVTETVSLDALPSTLDALRGPNSQCKVLVDPWKT